MNLMTNKLGSANPKNIPKRKKLTLVGEDLRQFDMKDIFENQVMKDDDIANRIDKIIAMKEQNNMFLGKVSEAHKFYDELVLKKDVPKWKLNVANKFLDESDAHYEKIEQMRIKIDKCLADEEAYVTKLLKDSKGQVDVYGVPQVISYEEWEKEFDTDKLNNLKKEVLKMLKTDKKFNDMLSKYNPKDDDYQNAVEYVFQDMDFLLTLVGKHQGQGYQKVIKPLQALYDIGRLKKASQKQGKRYISKSEQEIIQKLEIYWDDNLPLGDNRKSYFNKIADDYGKSFDAIKKIEKRNRPSTFKPSRK